MTAPAAAAAAASTSPLKSELHRTFWLLSISLNSVNVASMGLMAPLACAATFRWLRVSPTLGLATPGARGCMGEVAWQRGCCARRQEEAAAAACTLREACMAAKRREAVPKRPGKGTREL